MQTSTSLDGAELYRRLEERLGVLAAAGWAFDKSGDALPRLLACACELASTASTRNS